VTKPTTINAITDMPAKIPSPIGSTEIFFPGIWKAAAALALEDAVAVLLSAAAAMLLLAEGLVEGVVVGGGVLVAAGFETDESPMTDTPGSIGLEDAGGGEEVEDGGALEDDVEVVVLAEGGADWAPGVTVHCRTTRTRGSPLFPVTGVNVTMHDSVAGPEGVLTVCTVVVVIGCVSAWRRKTVSVEELRGAGAAEARLRRVQAKARKSKR